jgi:hypothetical protein
MAQPVSDREAKLTDGANDGADRSRAEAGRDVIGTLAADAAGGVDEAGLVVGREGEGVVGRTLADLQRGKGKVGSDW